MNLNFCKGYVDQNTENNVRHLSFFHAYSNWINISSSFLKMMSSPKYKGDFAICDIYIYSC